MKIGIIPNCDRDIGFKKTIFLVESILSFGAIAIISEDLVKDKEIVISGIVIDDYSDCDAIICLGGDGTFLTAIKRVHKLGIPIVGINLGSLGFLAQIDPENIKEALKQIISGDYLIEKRMMLDTCCYDQSGNLKAESVSLNDVVVNRSGVSRILDVDFYIDDNLVEKLPGDGVIVSTPTGSTAYSLSAGGPIIQPDLEMILINPLNPHTLHNRCYIAGSQSTIKIKINEYPDRPQLTSDGMLVCDLEENDYLIVKKSNYSMNLIKLEGSNFYRSISTKIFLRGR